MLCVCVAKERAKAVRTEPMFLDVDGHAFWRLDGYTEESNILVQGKFQLTLFLRCQELCFRL